MKHSIMTLHAYAVYNYAECHLCSVAIKFSLLSAVMLNVIALNVMAPVTAYRSSSQKYNFTHRCSLYDRGKMLLMYDFVATPSKQ
jgi:hypothetical protein